MKSSFRNSARGPDDGAVADTFSAGLSCARPPNFKPHTQTKAANPRQKERCMASSILLTIEKQDSTRD